MVDYICEICGAWCTCATEPERRICGFCAGIEAILNPEERRRSWMILDESGVVKVPPELLRAAQEEGSATFALSDDDRGCSGNRCADRIGLGGDARIVPRTAWAVWLR